MLPPEVAVVAFVVAGAEVNLVVGVVAKRTNST
jgi:hypothetical protein